MTQHILCGLDTSHTTTLVTLWLGQACLAFAFSPSELTLECFAWLSAKSPSHVLEFTLSHVRYAHLSGEQCHGQGTSLLLPSWLGRGEYCIMPVLSGWHVFHQDDASVIPLHRESVGLGSFSLSACAVLSDQPPDLL